MDKRNRNIAALGALTVAGTVVFFWGLYFMLGSPILGGAMSLFVLLDDGAGVKRGDPVLFQGVNIGSVGSVELTPRHQVLIELQLGEELALPEDTRASVAGDVFGAHSVSLVPGHSENTLNESDTIFGAPTAALTDLAADLGQEAGSVLRSADSVLAAAGALLAPATIADVQQTAAQLPATTRDLRAALAQFERAAASLRSTAETVEQAAPAEQMTTTFQQVERSAEVLARAAETLDSALVSLASVMGKIDNREGSLGLLVNDPTLYNQLVETMRELRVLATDVRERPQRYINLRIF